MALIRLNELSIGFHGPPLLDGVTCQIEPGQRIGLLGRNGSGKTTLMRMLAGADRARSWRVRRRARRQGFAAAAGGAAGSARAASTMSFCMALPPAELDESHVWQSEQRVDRLLSRMNLDANLEVRRSRPA